MASLHNNTVNLNVWDLSGQQAAAERLRKSGDERAQLQHAAKGFEQIMIRKMLEVARESSWDPKSGEQKSYQKMGDDQLAAAISNMGGFGMADALVKQMMGQIEAARKGQVAMNTKVEAPKDASAAPASGLNAKPDSAVNRSNN
jgi:Rod binding domain-containing protein